MSGTSSKITLPLILFFLLAALCLFPFVTAPVALLAGIIYALIFSHPYKKEVSKATGYLLKASVVGLGFGIEAGKALEAGTKGFLFTIITIIVTILLGIFIGRWAKIDKKITYLISAGTAICGGSAIAGVAPVIKAEQHQISVALGVVFIFNAIALYIFPIIGRALELTQQQFGVWAAIAIHDTSSVVGASNEYGSEANQIATTVKLARALWIIPIVFISAFVYKNDSGKINIPYFILMFFVAMLLNSYVHSLAPVSEFITMLAKRGVVVTLFLIGTGLSKEALKSVGFRPFVLGIILWLVIGISSLVVIIKTV